ncbi:response regulator transcription factor [Ascidiimonas sp. W6]|uniref:response regulator transcription factor n=1 Tax=Ascidiimonas meishanensis TaxID=3128903 RepID=UPI0030EE4025
MEQKITVLIVDDSIIFSQGLQVLLEQHKKVAKVKISHGYTSAMDKLRTHKIDIIILDLNFNDADYDGFIIAKKVRQLYPAIRIMILTQHAQIDHYETLVKQFKVNAYLDKQLGVEETFTAVNAVLAGKTYVDKNIAEMLSIGRFLAISKREREVINMLSAGYIQKEIGTKLFISPKTVETHIRNLCTKLKAKNSNELVSMYVKYRSANRENYDKTTPPFKQL